MAGVSGSFTWLASQRLDSVNAHNQHNVSFCYHSSVLSVDPIIEATAEAVSTAISSC